MKLIIKIANRFNLDTTDVIFFMFAWVLLLMLLIGIFIF